MTEAGRYNWSKRSKGKYIKMQSRHSVLWRYIHNYIIDNDIRSILEVGCGLCPLAKDWVPDWTGIDVNPKTDAVHEDFVKMDVSEYKGRDLFLACNVIEHCGDGLRPFLQKAMETKSRRYIITFFKNIKRKKSYIQYTGKGYYANKYSGDDILNTAWSLGFKCEIIYLDRRNIILHMERA